MTFISQNIKSSSSNIGNSDLDISVTGERTLKIGGDLSTDALNIANASGSTIMKVYGDRVVQMVTDVYMGGGRNSNYHVNVSGQYQLTSVRGGSSTGRWYGLNVKSINSSFGDQPGILIRGNTRTGSFAINSRMSSAANVNFTVFSFGSGNSPSQDALYLQGTNSAGQNHFVFTGQIHFGPGLRNYAGGLGSRSIVMESGTVPTGSRADAYIQYSADNSGIAGRASVHFMSEEGTVNTLGYFTGIGQATPGARLDVLAHGALSTDLAFRVRNSADTQDLLSLNGEGTIISNPSGVASPDDTKRLQLLLADGEVDGLLIAPRTNGLANPSMELRSGSNVNIKYQIDGNNGIGWGVNNKYLRMDGSSVASTFYWLYNNSGFRGWRIHAAGNTKNIFSLMKSASSNSQAVIGIGNSMNIGPTTTGIPDVSYGGNSIWFLNGATPTGSLTDGFGVYSADIVAGNAAPHFRTEAGDIVKLYSQDNTIGSATFVANTSGISDDTATFGGFTLGQIAQALINNGILK